MKKTIGILAHVDAGKTTFAEQILYHTNSIKELGRVDHKSSHLDNHEIEKARGITVFSDQAVFTYNNSTYYLIDTPGHVDFSTEMERALQIMDYAIVIVSAVEGVEGHTETVWNLLNKHQVPTFFFINKIDRIGANVDRVMNEIKTTLTEDCFDFTDAFDGDRMNESLIEWIAMKDESLLERYLNEGFDQQLWLTKLIEMIKELKITPSFSGSALKDINIKEFINKLDTLTITDYKEENRFSGQVYKVRHDDKGNRVTYIKALSGRLNVKDEVNYFIENEELSDKVNEIRIYNGSKYTSVQHVSSGDVFGVTGLTNVRIGNTIGDINQQLKFELIPTLKSAVILDDKLSVKEVLNHFRLLEDEDPSLNVVYEEKLKQINIHVMGVIQLEVLEQLIENRFGYQVNFGVPEILYKETIKNTVIGYGHFEPLKHYAEVHLKIEPAKRNSGITVVSEAHVDELSTGNQNLIRHHIFEKEHNGILTGSALTDLKITLLTGRAHQKHTSGGDFREATLRALRQGLEKANNVLLEPYYFFKIKINIEHLGKVLTDIKKANGNYNSPDIDKDNALVTGTVPVSTFINYSTQLASFTHGKGFINLSFKGYDICHNPSEAIEKIAYNKNADPNYTSSSMFCSKGQSYSVNWEEAENKMHCTS